MKTIGIFLKYEMIGEGEEGKHRVFFMNRSICVFREHKRLGYCSNRLYWRNLHVEIR